MGRAHAILRTIVVKAEALLNDCPITYTWSNVWDPEPITTSRLLHGRRITTLPHSTVHDDQKPIPELGDASEIKHKEDIIPCSSSCKDLRIHFSYSFCWQQHYQSITSKAYKTLGLLHQIFKDNNCIYTRMCLHINCEIQIVVLLMFMGALPAV